MFFLVTYFCINVRHIHKYVGIMKQLIEYFYIILISKIFILYKEKMKFEIGGLFTFRPYIGNRSKGFKAIRISPM